MKNKEELKEKDVKLFNDEIDEDDTEYDDEYNIFDMLDLKNYCLDTISSNLQYDYDIRNITITDDSIIMNNGFIIEINIKNGGENNDL